MWGSKTQRFRTYAVLYAWEQAAWADDQKFTWEDLDETIYAGIALAFIWKGEWILATIPGINLVEGLVVGGAVVSFAIGGVEGVEDYIDFMAETPKMLAEITLGQVPEKIKFTAETIYEHKIEEPLTMAARRYVGWVDRRMEEVQSVWRVTMPTWPSLPF